MWDKPIIGDSKTQVKDQSIKYWDFAASQYDFWAYSLGDGSATVSTLNHEAALGTSAYTISGSLEDLSKVYISDLQTAYNPNKTVSGVGSETTEPAVMGNEVELRFRSLVTKVRIGLYETIPGYSVKSVKFYADNTTTLPQEPKTTATLFAPNNGSKTQMNSTQRYYTVRFPTIG